MKRIVLYTTRGLLLALVLGIFGGLTLSVLPALVQAQDAPAADCDAGPQVACPTAENSSAQYIGSVTAAPDAVIILLTNAGLDKARECDGPEAIATMAQALYETIPAGEKSAFQLDWTSETLHDEIYGHAFFNQLSNGIGGLGGLLERSNPINVVFADYGGPGQMSDTARAEHATFAALGAVHRAAC